MRVLLDENLDWRLRRYLSGHVVETGRAWTTNSGAHPAIERMRENQQDSPSPNRNASSGTYKDAE